MEMEIKALRMEVFALNKTLKVMIELMAKQAVPAEIIAAEIVTVDTERMDAAKSALNGLLAMQASPNLGGTGHMAYFDHGRSDLMAKDAFALADALIAESKVEKECCGKCHGGCTGSEGGLPE